MTPRDHNKTVSIAHGLVGVFVLMGLIIAAVLEARRRPSDVAERLSWILFALPLPFLQLSTAYGLFVRRKWSRVLGLLLSVLYVFIFPLGTLLAAYTWWFLQSEGGRRLYGVNQEPEGSDG
jgi:hypothetical protein